jgi:F-type H+-transporting ATPase subunit delta
LKYATIGKNYAEALLAAAGALGQVDAFGTLMDAVAGAVSADPRIAAVLASPRVTKAVKGQLLAEALEDAAPAEFIRFLQAVMRRGRQALLGDIAQQYQVLVDVQQNRVHAGVTLSTAPDEALTRRITERLSEVLGKEVRAHMKADPGILGGVVVRIGDRVYDGSLKRRLTTLRRRMLTGD